MILKLLKSNSFGLAILACAAVSFAFSAAFTSWGGVKLTRCSTLLSPFVTPLLVKALAGRFIANVESPAAT